MAKTTPSVAYELFLNDITGTIQNARIQAARVVNRELTLLYRDIGKQIVEAQKKHGWGKSIVEQLSVDLMKQFPGRSGFATRNLWFMRQFYSEYVDYSILQSLTAELPWTQNVTILTYVHDMEARRYYIESTIEMGWSVRVLEFQIKAQAYERHRLAPKQHNFKNTLPEHLAEQADSSLKDIYMLDFLGIQEPILEAALESRMVQKITEVILEFGKGFAFMGNQYRIKANNTEYLVDLLFYNRHLQCLVAIELKVGAFKPEYAGKMNFYLNLLDDFVRQPHENPSIGIVLCSGRNRFEVEYALRGINKPMGVSEYQLTPNAPESLQEVLPDVEMLEHALNKELEEAKNQPTPKAE
jgi:predicted nuclease of restriction endonuclease-like (RecB) superfamily